MNSLVDQSNSIWLAIQQRIEFLIQAGGSLARVEAFIPRTRLRVGQQSNPALHVISRVTRVTEWGANRGIGELAITFGVTQSTVRPEDVGSELEELIHALVLDFMDRPNLGGSDDVRVDEINPDDNPFGSEDTLPWATATLNWVFQFTQT